MGMENHKNKCMEGEEGAEDVVTGEKKKYETIQCDICNKKFVSKNSLKKHKKAFHGPRVDFPCQFCAGTPKAYIGHTTTFNSILKDALVIQIELYCTVRYARISQLIGPRK